jgi:hypothetical protein
MAIPLAARIAASPMGPASQLSSRWPQSKRIACPISNDAAQTTTSDAYVASATRARIVDGRSNG